MLIECKGLSTPLNEKHLAQLFRYFTVTDARFAILTNGREYWFYTDLEAPNKLDRSPFFKFDVLDYSRAGLQELQKFEKASFSVDGILAQAERLKFVMSIRQWLSEQLDAPSDGFVRLATAEVFDGRRTADVRETIRKGIPTAFRELIRDRVRDRLSSALDDSAVADDVAEPSTAPTIETTEEEIEGYLIVKSILRGQVASERIFIRDAKSYCAVLLDDNNRKPLARLHFNRRQKYIGLFDGDSEDRIAIASLDDMLDYTDRIKAMAEKHG
jgi:hypothetical protein